METPDQEKLRKAMEEQNSEERGRTVMVMLVLIVFMCTVIMVGIILLKQWMN